MDRDDQQLVGRLEFDVESLQMDSKSAVDSEAASNTHWCTNHRSKLKELLHCQRAQYFIVGLVVLDCAIVIAELIVDLEVLKGEIDNIAPHILHYTSIAILSIFLVELVLKIYAMGLEYFKHKLEVFDGIVVIISFALDIAFSHSSAASGAGLLVILRLWRLTRIVNGIVMSVKIQSEKKIELLDKEKQEMQKELEQLKTRNHELEMQVNLLRNEQGEHSEQAKDA